MTSRRKFIAGTAAVGAAWVVPQILVAQPSAGATLSFAPLPASATPVTQTAGKPLAFTGDNTEQDAGIGAGLIAAGWLLTRWRAQS